jgi:hypothetical protein
MKKAKSGKGDEEKKETRLSVADIASKIDSRLRFLELAMWNLAEGRTPEGGPLDVRELGDALSVMMADMRKDVLPLYDA